MVRIYDWFTDRDEENLEWAKNFLNNWERKNRLRKEKMDYDRELDRLQEQSRIDKSTL